MNDSVLSNFINRCEQGDIHKMLQSIGEQFDELHSQNVSLRQRLSGFRKDEAIAEQARIATDIRKHSLLIMTDNEMCRRDKFREDHRRSCNNSSTFQYEISGTSVGSIVKIKCPVCSEEYDLTDYESW